MKKILLLIIVCLIGFTNAFAQCDTAVQNVFEDFNEVIDPNDRTILPECWVANLPNDPRANGSIQIFNGTLLINSTFGGSVVTPVVENSQGTITFKARLENFNSATLELFVVGGGSGSVQTFQLDRTLRTFTYDFSNLSRRNDNLPGRIGFRFINAGSSINMQIDDVEYKSFCLPEVDPTVVAKDISARLDLSGNLILNPSLVNDGSTDGCGEPVTLFSLDKTLFTCDDLGPNTVTLTGDDGNGHTATATAVVTIEPTISVNNRIISLDESGMGVFSVEDRIAQSSTMCDNITYTVDQSTFTCNDTGFQAIEVTATYPNGSFTTSFTATVSDFIAPTVVTQNIDVTIDETTGLSIITPEMIDNGSSDNCSIASMSLDKTTFTCDEQGENTVTLTVIDNSNRSTTATAIVNVLSFIPEQEVTASNTAVCFGDNSTVSETISINGSYVGADYYLRNDKDSSVIEGPIAGTGNGLDFSIGTIDTTTTFHVYAEIPFSGNALSLPRSNEYLALSTPINFDYSTGYTFSAWINERQGGISNSFNTLFYAGGATGSDIEVYQNALNGHITIVHNRGNGGVLSSYVIRENLLPSAEYAHMAVTYDGGTSRVYINGVERGSSILAAPVKSAASELTFGFLNNSAFPGRQDFEGLLDDIRIYGIARDGVDIAGDMSRCLAGTESDLLLYFNMESASGSILTDLVNNTPAQIINQNSGGIVSDGAISCSFTCDRIMDTKITIGDGEVPNVVLNDMTIDIDPVTFRTIINFDDLNNGSSDNCTSVELLEPTLSQTVFTCENVGENTVTVTLTDSQGNVGTAEAIVTVNPVLTDQTVSAASTGFCAGEDASAGVEITVADSELNTSYFLRNSLDNSLVESLDGTGEALVFNTGAISENTTFNVAASKGRQATNLGLNFVKGNTASTGFSYASTKTMTMELWVLPTSTDRTSFISNFGGAGGEGPGVIVLDNAVSGGAPGTGLRLFIGSQIGSSFVLTATDAITLNEWNHIVFTFDFGFTTLIVNGRGVANATADFTEIVSLNNRINLGGDRRSTFNTTFVGQMDDFRVWNVVRTPAQISGMSNVCLTGEEEGLVAYYPLDEGSGRFIRDLVNGTNDQFRGRGIPTWISPDNGLICQSCEQQIGEEVTITVNDVAPTAVTKNITLSLGQDGTATLTPEAINDGSTDDCTSLEDLTFAIDITAFDCEDMGENDVVLTVTDALNNSSTSTATVTIVDDSGPTGTVNDFAVVLDVNGIASITSEDIFSNAADNCSTTDDLTIQVNQTVFSCDDIGENVISISVSDTQNNTSTFTTTVTVSESELPVAMVQNITVNLGTDGMVTVMPIALDNGSSDNCTPANELVFSLDQSTFSCGDLGENTVVFTVTDESSNIATASATITVTDDIAPTVVTQNIIARLDQNNNASIIPADVDNGSTDNCSSGLTLSLDITDFDETNLGENTVILTATDASGNSSTASAIVTVAPFKLEQTITFEMLADKIYGDGTFDLAASASSSLGVGFAVQSGPAVINGNTVTISGAGTVVIEASQPGNDDYLAAPLVTQSFVIAKAPLTVTADDQSITFGDPLPTYTVSYAGFVNGETAAILNANITTSVDLEEGFTAGSYDIMINIALSDVSDNYEFSAVNGTLTINKADQIITIDPIDDVLVDAPAFDISTSVDSNLPLVITITGPATINANTITLDGTPGTVQVTVMQEGNVNFNSALVTEEFEVNTVTSIGDEVGMISLNLYPNPVQDVLHIEGAENYDHVRIISLDGQVHFNRDFTQEAITIQHLKTGMYIIELTNNHSKITRSFIKR